MKEVEGKEEREEGAKGGGESRLWLGVLGGGGGGREEGGAAGGIVLWRLRGWEERGGKGGHLSRSGFFGEFLCRCCKVCGGWRGKRGLGD